MGETESLGVGQTLQGDSVLRLRKPPGASGPCRPERGLKVRFYWIYGAIGRGSERIVHCGGTTSARRDTLCPSGLYQSGGHPGKCLSPSLSVFPPLFLCSRCPLKLFFHISRIFNCTPLCKVLLQHSKFSKTAQVGSRANLVESMTLNRRSHM